MVVLPTVVVASTRRRDDLEDSVPQALAGAAVKTADQWSREGTYHQGTRPQPDPRVASPPTWD